MPIIHVNCIIFHTAEANTEDVHSFTWIIQLLVMNIHMN